MSVNAPLFTVPITKRPPHGPLFSKIFFPSMFILGLLGINSAQILLLPLQAFGPKGRELFDHGIGWTKDGFGRLLIVITVLFAPTSLVLTTDGSPSIADLVERDAAGEMVRINLPDRLVLMANHQAYTDWMYLWILSAYAGHSKGIIILLKASLRGIPIVGWGMRFFHFVFLSRSWAADRINLTLALTDLGKQAKAVTGGKRNPLWLLIFPEGTITSDEERAKSKRYAEREGVDDFVTTLHPRSTGLLFCLRTLLPEIPDLQLLDITIGYPGVPYGGYPQEWYGLLSVFFRSVPPPTVHLHLRLYSNLASPDSGIPSLLTASDEEGLAPPADAKKFELWLRERWTEKEMRMRGFFTAKKFVSEEGSDLMEIVPVKQLSVPSAFALPCKLTDVFLPQEMVSLDRGIRRRRAGHGGCRRVGPLAR
ncbi:hypothetical protein P7C73_g3495, partial [Tremellales sp. Uapishka_1]